MTSNNSNWIAVDWGTSSLRIWCLDHNGAIVAQHKSEQGMATLTPAEYEPVLVNIIEPWLDLSGSTLVIVCGMAGARQGWCEAPYSQVPCKPLNADQLTSVVTKDSRIQVVIVPGICQTTPADVMRGEETQIAGYLSSQNIENAHLCLPGTHSKWVSVENNIITGFTTFMTGELYSLLSKQSILSHSINDNEWSDACFSKAVHDAWHSPEDLTSKLFSIRANSLIGQSNSAIGQSELSGLLVGMELRANCANSSNSTKEISLIGDSHITSRYSQAMETLSIRHRVVDATDITLAGLKSVYLRLRE